MFPQTFTIFQSLLRRDVLLLSWIARSNWAWITAAFNLTDTWALIEFPARFALTPCRNARFFYFCPLTCAQQLGSIWRMGKLQAGGGVGGGRLTRGRRWLPEVSESDRDTTPRGEQLSVSLMEINSKPKMNYLVLGGRQDDWRAGNKRKFNRDSKENMLIPPKIVFQLSRFKLPMT